jgi:hypothetical protein
VGVDYMNIGVTELAVFVVTPLLVIFILGFYVGKYVGFKEGLREGKLGPAAPSEDTPPRRHPFDPPGAGPPSA